MKKNTFDLNVYAHHDFGEWRYTFEVAGDYIDSNMPDPDYVLTVEIPEGWEFEVVREQANYWRLWDRNGKPWEVFVPRKELKAMARSITQGEDEIINLKVLEEKYQ